MSPKYAPIVCKEGAGAGGGRRAKGESPIEGRPCGLGAWKKATWTNARDLVAETQGPGEARGGKARAERTYHGRAAELIVEIPVKN